MGGDDTELSKIELVKAGDSLSQTEESPCDLAKVEHPEGRFRREDGTRYDICVMATLSHPDLRAPALSRVEFVGDCADNQPVVIRLGNVRQSSFRVRLIASGAAFGTLSAAAKSSTVVGA